MQEKKKESLLPNVPSLLIVIGLTVADCIYFREDISIRWIAIQVAICLAIGYAFEAFQRHQRKKYGLEEVDQGSSQES
ncbi:hypothetical protein [Urinicoccus timonensis]|uniref:hypothetical protein n=1 Tax=Urinicoccus timonensis TaxID=2024205 RepID=UPI000C075343|nr:hypothetical protein [Urinicoccus timonensis]